MLRRLYERLSEYRDLAVAKVDLAVILSGQAEPLRALLHANPPLAARFLAVIDFPGYTSGQLAAIVVVLADEAGLGLTTGARSKAAAVLAQAGRSGFGERAARGRAAEPGDRCAGAPGRRRASRGQTAGDAEHDHRRGHPGLPAA